MRIKRKPWAEELYAQNKELYLKFPTELRGKWSQFFGNDHPIEVEVGSGKGGFITQLAQKYPEKNFIAFEINEMALAYLLRTQQEQPLKNLFLVIGNAKEINQYFAPNEISNLYLNFSDPWPKTRHEKRRLTAPSFLNNYHEVLASNGHIKFKTDNQGLFTYSLMTIANDRDLMIDKLTFDLHNSVYAKDNIETEYEMKFSAMGEKIFMLEAHFEKEE